MHWYVWMSVGDKAYRLLRFNESGGGVYVIDEDPRNRRVARYKFSLHTNGKSHGRTSGEKHKHEEFTLAPIKDSSTHLMVSQWRPIHPDVIRDTAPIIKTRPPANSESIFIGDARDLFEPYCNLVVETYLYDREKSLEIETHVHSNMPHRQHMELKLFKRFPLEYHPLKVFGVAIYIAQLKHEEAA